MLAERGGWWTGDGTKYTRATSTGRCGNCIQLALVLGWASANPVMIRSDQKARTLKVRKLLNLSSHRLQFAARRPHNPIFHRRYLASDVRPACFTPPAPNSFRSSLRNASHLGVSRYHAIPHTVQQQPQSTSHQQG